MIHIVTIHHETDKFIDLQDKYFQRYTESPYKIYAGLCNANIDHYVSAQQKGEYEHFEFVDLNEVENQHWYRMNYLTHYIAAVNPNLSDEDWLVFVDGDAFPVWPWEESINTLLNQDGLQVVAVDRLENPEPLLDDFLKPYPHPCFCVTFLKWWVDNALAWELHGAQIPTAGPLLKLWLQKNEYNWAGMSRTNLYNLHPLYFGIYGGIIYHHGAGNRMVYDSIDIWPRHQLGADTDLDIRYPCIPAANKRLSDLVFNEIISDDEFINVYLMGRPG